MESTFTIQGAVVQVLQHVVGTLLVVGEVRAEKIGEEEHLQHGHDEHDLDDDDLPQRPAHRHAAEAVTVEVEYPFHWSPGRERQTVRDDSQPAGVPGHATCIDGERRDVTMMQGWAC